MARVSSADQLAQLRPLARRIARGECVLVLGPGAAVTSGEPQGTPVSVKLSELLAADQRISRTEGLDPRDLRHVSQVLYEATRSLTTLQETVADFYAGHSDLSSTFHRNIASLPFKLCLTTTPDDFLYNAFVDAGKTPCRQFYNFRRARRSEPLAAPTVERPLIYHLYGYAEEPDSLVITENDLIDAVAAVIRDIPPLPVLVRSELAKPTTTCLFVDLGFKNWYLRALLRALSLFGHQDSSIAVEDSDFFRHSGLHQTALYFSASQAIQFRQESLDEFSSNLKQVYEQLTPARKPPGVAPPEGAPRVFLSYAHDDQDAADRLADAVRCAGIAVWQDHQNLRVGDRWEQALIQVISKQVDYMVILQSPAMATRVESYVAREVNEGLRRQNCMLWGHRFLMPVRLGEAPMLPELANLHVADVQTDAGVRALVAAITEDWQKRCSRSAAVERGQVQA